MEKPMNGYVSGDIVFWADADPRTPFHLKLRKATVVKVNEGALKAEIECEEATFVVGLDRLFRTFSLGVLEAG